jgi:hypothetical protein
MYYLNDHTFFLDVLDREEPPYDFKMHVFAQPRYADRNNEDA